MKKIISILILFLITFVFTQITLAGPKESCEKCCERIATANNQAICKGNTACGQTTAKVPSPQATQACQTGCNAITIDTEQSLCDSCCSSLAYAISSPITNYQQIATLISTATRWFQGIVMAIAIIMIIYGGVLYITAAGSEEKAKTARKLLLYACIGIAVVLLAWGAEFLILSFLTP